MRILPLYKPDACQKQWTLLSVHPEISSIYQCGIKNCRILKSMNLGFPPVAWYSYQNLFESFQQVKQTYMTISICVVLCVMCDIWKLICLWCELDGLGLHLVRSIDDILFSTTLLRTAVGFTWFQIMCCYPVRQLQRHSISLCCWWMHTHWAFPLHPELCCGVCPFPCCNGTTAAGHLDGTWGFKFCSCSFLQPPQACVHYPKCFPQANVITPTIKVKRMGVWMERNTGRYTGGGSKEVWCKCGGRVDAWDCLLWYQSSHTNVCGRDDADGVFL